MTIIKRDYKNLLYINKKDLTIFNITTNQKEDKLLITEDNLIYLNNIISDDIITTNHISTLLDKIKKLKLTNLSHVLTFFIYKSKNISLKIKQDLITEISRHTYSFLTIRYIIKHDQSFAENIRDAWILEHHHNLMLNLIKSIQINIYWFNNIPKNVISEYLISLKDIRTSSIKIYITKVLKGLYYLDKKTLLETVKQIYTNSRLISYDFQSFMLKENYSEVCSLFEYKDVGYEILNFHVNNYLDKNKDVIYLNVKFAIIANMQFFKSCRVIIEFEIFVLKQNRFQCTYISKKFLVHNGKIDNGQHSFSLNQILSKDKYKEGVYKIYVIVNGRKDSNVLIVNIHKETKKNIYIF